MTLSTEKPWVTVVIPAKNAAFTLQETLDSVVAQTFKQWDAIVIDDGSEDGTLDIALKMVERDARFRCIPGPKRGVSAARNFGVSHAQAPLIAFLDADDLWSKDKLALQVDHLQKDTRVGLSYSRVAFLDVLGRPTGVVSKIKRFVGRPWRLLYENPTCTASSVVVRKFLFDAIDGFDESMKYSEDLEFLVRLQSLCVTRIEGLPQILTSYRASRGGASANLNAMQSGWEFMMNKVSVYDPYLVRDHYSAARAIHLRYLSRRAIRLGHSSSEALRLFGQAARSNPWILLTEPVRTFGTLAAILVSRLAQSWQKHLPYSRYS
jgi:glycosyltransferase involved in cell wall biosynthesis